MRAALFLLLTLPALAQTGIVTVQGAVKNPGRFPLHPATTLTQLLQQPQPPRVLLWHGYGDGHQASWSQVQVLKPADEVKLQDGDLIYVPNSSQGPTASITGEVQNQGRFFLGRDACPLDLITASGGLLGNADLTDVTLVRAGQTFPVDLSPPHALALQSQKLRNGDLVYVGRQLRIGVAGEVGQRGVYMVSRHSPDQVGELLKTAEVLPSASLGRMRVVRPTLPEPLQVDARQPGATRLQDGDTLLVPALSYIIIGTVTAPGKFPLQGGETLGSILPNSQLQRVVVIRAAEIDAFEPKQEVYDLTDPSHLGVPIYDGDLIYVPRENGALSPGRPPKGAPYIDERPVPFRVR